MVIKLPYTHMPVYNQSSEIDSTVSSLTLLGTDHQH